MGACEIEVGSLDAVEAVLRQGGVAAMRQDGRLVAHFCPELGCGAWVFVAPRS
jgi:hypothetical protein